MKTKFRIVVMMVVLILAFQVIAVVAEGNSTDDTPYSGETRAVSGDCTAQATDYFENNPVSIPFSCSVSSTVYFGVCDSGGVPNDDLFSIRFRGRVVSRNSYQGGAEVVVIGNGPSEAGTNTAIMERLNFPDQYATYSYAISTDLQEVKNYLEPECGADLQGIVAQITLAEETIPVGPGQTVETESISIGDYPTVYFRATWVPVNRSADHVSKSDAGLSKDSSGGSSQSKDGKPEERKPNDGGFINIIDEATNEPLDMNDPGVTHVPGETFDEVIVENLPPGNYRIEFTADDTFSANEVTLGAYTYDQGSGGGQRGAIQGRVFNDENRNGVYDAGEFGIPGVSVTLYSPGDWYHTFTSGEGGIYNPVALGKVYWDVEVTVPEGYVATSPTRIEGIGIGIDGFPSGAIGVDFGLVGDGTAATAESSQVNSGAPSAMVAASPSTEVSSDSETGFFEALFSRLMSSHRTIIAR